jgi:phosphoglycolate phosphatase-like HAD superfamily hydrolase
MKKVIKALAFDFDGTLIESNEIKDKAFYSIFSEWPEHRDAMMQWHLANNTMVRKEKFKYFVRVFLGKVNHGQLVEKLTQRFSYLSYDAIVKCPMVDGALEFLDVCVDRVQMSLISATPHNELNKILKARLLTKYFKVIRGGPINKEEVLKYIICNNNITPDEMLYIGDCPEDQLVAKTLGCNFIGRKSSRELNPIANSIYSNFVEIKDHCDRCYIL